MTAAINTVTTETTVEKKPEFKPRVVFPDHIYQEIMWYVRKSSVEVSGFCDLEYDPKTQTFTAISVHVCDQHNEATRTRQINQSVSNKLGEANVLLLERGVDITKAHACKLWWHSHVNMNVFWSSTDMDAMRDIGYNGWIVASVFNKRNEIRSAFMSVTEILGEKHELFIDNLQTDTQRWLDPELTSEWDKKYEAAIIPEPPRQYQRSGGLHDKDSIFYKHDPDFYWEEKDKCWLFSKGIRTEEVRAMKQDDRGSLPTPSRADYDEWDYYGTGAW